MQGLATRCWLCTRPKGRPNTPPSPTVQLTGSRMAAQVAGNFHFAPGRSFQQGNMHVHDLVPFQTTEFDTSHTVHHLAFGQEFPGMTNPLDNAHVHRINPHNPTGTTGMYQYFLKVGLLPPGGAQCSIKSSV